MCIKYRNYKNNFNFGNTRKYVLTEHHYNEVKPPSMTEKLVLH